VVLVSVVCLVPAGIVCCRLVYMFSVLCFRVVCFSVLGSLITDY